jgi:hypothetical protein
MTVGWQLGVAVESPFRWRKFAAVERMLSTGCVKRLQEALPVHAEGGSCLDWLHLHMLHAMEFQLTSAQTAGPDDNLMLFSPIAGCSLNLMLFSPIAGCSLSEREALSSLTY